MDIVESCWSLPVCGLDLSDDDDDDDGDETYCIDEIGDRSRARGALANDDCDRDRDDDWDDNDDKEDNDDDRDDARGDRDSISFNLSGWCCCCSHVE